MKRGLITAASAQRLLQKYGLPMSNLTPRVYAGEPRADAVQEKLL